MENFDPNKMETQIIKDYAGLVVCVEFIGKCIACQSNTFEGTNHQTSPLGVLGHNDAYPYHAHEHEKVGPSIPVCFMCANDGEIVEKKVKPMMKQLWSDINTKEQERGVA